MEIFDGHARAMENKVLLQKTPEHRKVDYSDGLNLFFSRQSCTQVLNGNILASCIIFFLAEQMSGENSNEVKRP